MTLTIADIIGILAVIAGTGGLLAGLNNFQQIKALNAKLLAEAQKTKSEADKIEQEKTSAGMNAVVGGTQVVIETGNTLLSGLIARIEKLEGQLKDKEEEIIRIHRAYNIKISRILKAIEKNISKRNEFIEKSKCPHECVFIDSQLQKDLSHVLTEDIPETK